MQYLKSRFLIMGENSRQARDNYAAHHDQIFGTAKPKRPASAGTRRRDPAQSA